MLSPDLDQGHLPQRHRRSGRCGGGGSSRTAVPCRAYQEPGTHRVVESSKLTKRSAHRSGQKHITRARQRTNSVRLIAGVARLSGRTTALLCRSFPLSSVLLHQTVPSQENIPRRLTWAPGNAVEAAGLAASGAEKMSAIRSGVGAACRPPAAGAAAAPASPPPPPNRSSKSSKLGTSCWCCCLVTPGPVEEPGPARGWTDFPPPGAVVAAAPAAPPPLPRRCVLALEILKDGKPRSSSSSPSSSDPPPAPFCLRSCGFLVGIDGAEAGDGAR